MCIIALIISALPVHAQGQNPLLKRLRGTDGKSVLVLMYHRLSDKISENNDFCIQPAEFEKDIKLLAENGYIFCTASELAEYEKDNKKGGKLAAITFDDGYESDYLYALPVLKKYNAKATFFVFGDAIGKDGYMTKEQLYELAQSPYAEIGNHSYKIHNKSIAEIRSAYASGKQNQMLADDFIKNKKLLEEITKKNVTALSYPNGVYNSGVDTMLRNYGVKVTFSTEERMERIPFSNRVIGRFNRGMNTNISNYLVK